MTPIYYCATCQHAWQILGSIEERDNLTMLLRGVDNVGCITPLCGGRLIRATGIPSGFALKELPIRSFYRAIHGFGTGEGDPALASEFARLLKTKKIVDLSVTAVGQPERVLVHQIILEDGTRMHFDSSSRGACCYYIERPSKSCVEVVEDEFSSDEAIVRHAAPDREEAGRGYERAEGSSEPEPDARPESYSGAGSTRTAPVPIVREGAYISKG